MFPRREAIRDALGALLDDRRYAEITVEDVCARAGIGREDFERAYGGLDDVLLDLYRLGREQLMSDTLAAFTAAPSWRDGFRASAWATCRYLQSDPRRARIMLCEMEREGEVVQAERDRGLDLYIELIHSARLETEDPDSFPRDIAAGIACTIWDRINHRVTAGELDRLAEDVPELLHFALLPYFGPEVAQEELRRGREMARNHRLN